MDEEDTGEAEPELGEEEISESDLEAMLKEEGLEDLELDAGGEAPEPELSQEMAGGALADLTETLRDEPQLEAEEGPLEDVMPEEEQEVIPEAAETTVTSESPVTEPEKISTPPEAEAVTVISEEKIEAMVTATLQNVVERVARETMESTVEKLIAEATAKAEDGMVLPVYHTWTEINMSALPEPEKIYEKIGDLADLLNRLCSAPFGEPYSGPVIMSGEASGVFFHEIFGHRTEGQRMKKADDGQPFKSMVGKEVLPGSFTVYGDPVLEHYDGSFLWGSYLYDDEGVKGEKTILVENGRLKEFLMSRTPMELFGASNGHGRAAPGRDPVARQSNLVVSSDVTVTEGEMILRFKKMLKVKGLSYGYYIESVTGGFTQTGRYKPNAFNVIPTVVYRIYADERPRELVRGIDLIGTPLSIFSHIEAAGNDTGIFTGYCGAESGMVPVTCVSPSLLVREIEFQKKKLSQSKRPVLSRPDTRDKEKP